jgi:hypothetical protein
MDILLGYEIGTGAEVRIPLRHTAIFGMTQLSGKTTALEAIITRSGLRAVAFITKRGEAGFKSGNPIIPFYRPRADWQFVESLVNVALNERVKYETGMRSAIMRACRKATGLDEIRREALHLAAMSKGEFMKSVFEHLVAYLDIVVPELARYTFSTSLDLKTGVNVMALADMRAETQQLVIASCIEEINRVLDHVIVVVPEAWEMLPQSRLTPVKWVAQQFIRKGAALGNFMFLDSQDIGGIDKTPLRQVDNWLLGRMREAHEVERFSKQVLGAKIPADEVQTLKVGHFIAVLGDQVKRVYVLPAGVPEDMGIKVAKGQMTVEEVSQAMMACDPHVHSLNGVPVDDYFRPVQVPVIPLPRLLELRLEKLEKEVANLERKG